MVKDIILVSLILGIITGGMAGLIKWQREDAVRDFMREAALKAAEKKAADQSTKDRIAKEIDNATIDDLRERAAAGGMFVDTD